MFRYDVLSVDRLRRRTTVGIKIENHFNLEISE